MRFHASINKGEEDEEYRTAFSQVDVSVCPRIDII